MLRCVELSLFNDVAAVREAQTHGAIDYQAGIVDQILALAQESDIRTSASTINLVRISLGSTIESASRPAIRLLTVPLVPHLTKRAPVNTG